MTFGSLNALLQQHHGANPDNRSALEVNGMTLVEPMAAVPAAKRRKAGSALSSVSRFGSNCVSVLAPAQPCTTMIAPMLCAL